MKLFIRLFFCFFIYLPFLSCSRQDNFSEELQKALKNLDQTLALRAEIDAMKQDRITDFKSQLSYVSNERELYQIYDHIFGEYNKYNVDSAIVYAGIKMDCAYNSGEKDLILDAVFDMVERYTLSGMHYGAIRIIGQADTSAGLSLWERHRYNLAQQSIYEGLAQTAQDPRLKKEYLETGKKYRNRRQEASEQDWLSYTFVSAEALMEKGAFAKAQELLSATLESDHLPQQDRAILNYLLATCYERSGEKNKAMLYYAISADDDLRAPIKEHRSLGILSTLLYENGEVDRAHQYINRAFEDAVSVNSRPSLDYISGSLPVITTAYEELVYEKNKRQRELLMILGVLLIALVTTMLLVFQDRRKISEASKEIKKNNMDIQRINARLERYIVRLNDANMVKEKYLGRYIDLFSSHINSLEIYRSMLRGIAKTRDFSEITAALKSDDFIDAERKRFYESFDSTFLGLYPDFVQHLNRLLKPDQQVSPAQKDGMLTTELRVFALIRLGITDSTQIAGFLKKSVSTVYNYRVKLRNAALNDREDLEKNIMSIGKPVLQSSIIS